MARVALQDLRTSPDEDVRAIHDYLMEHREKDYVAEHWQIEANFPAVFKHVFRLYRAAIWEEGDLPQELLEQIAVAVSVANGCDYCTGAFCTHLQTRFDYDDAAVVGFVDDVREGTLDGRERAVIDFALKTLDDPQAVTDADVEGLRGHGLDDADLVHVVYVVNLISGFNRLVDTFDAAYDHWFGESLVETGLEGE